MIFTLTFCHLINPTIASYYRKNSFKEELCDPTKYTVAEPTDRQTTSPLYNWAPFRWVCSSRPGSPALFLFFWHWRGSQGETASDLLRGVRRNSCGEYSYTFTRTMKSRGPSSRYVYTRLVNKTTAWRARARYGDGGRLGVAGGIKRNPVAQEGTRTQSCSSSRIGVLVLWLFGRTSRTKRELRRASQVTVPTVSAGNYEATFSGS